MSEESLAANVARLKEYMSRLVVYPKKSNKAKKGDTPKDQQSGETISKLSSSFAFEPLAPGFTEISKGDVPAGVEGGAYRALRKARSDARLKGTREKRAKEKAEAETAKKA